MMALPLMHNGADKFARKRDDTSGSGTKPR
jgi:hypothetical protein